MYAIKSEGHGVWWTGETWGVEQAREEYTCLDDLPDRLPPLPGGSADLVVEWTPGLLPEYLPEDADEFTTDGAAVIGV